MKCPNCGFENDSMFCQMCGTKLPEQPAAPSVEPPANENPYYKQPSFTAPNQFVFDGNANPENSINPVNQGFVPQNPFEQNTAQPNSAQDFYQNYNAPVAPPVNPINTGNADSAVQSGMPVPPQYQNSSASKPKKKAMPIVLTIIVCIIVFAGIAISIVSSLTYSKSFFQNMMDAASSLDDIDPYISENENEFFPNEDYSFHYMGENVKLGSSEIKFINYSVKEIDTEAVKKNPMFSGYKQLDVEFELKNTLDDSFFLSIYEFNGDAYIGDTGSEYLEPIAYNGEYCFEDYDIDIRPLDAGKTEKFTLSFAVPENYESVGIRFDDYSEDYTHRYDENVDTDKIYSVCTFSVDLKKQSEVEPSSSSN